MKKALTRRVISLFLCLCIVIGFVPIIDAQAAEIKGGTFDPHTGNLELEFGYQLTQYININVYVRSPSDDGLSKQYVGSIVENYLLTGADEMTSRLPEDSQDTMVSPYTPVTKTDGGLVELSEDGIYQADKNFAGEEISPVPMMKHTLIWDGSLDGIPIIGPNLDEDVFYLTVEIEPLGRPDKNVECTDSKGSHTHGQNYTWPQKQENGKKKFAVSTELLVDYRDYVVGEDGTAAFLMLEGSLSDEVRKKLYEQFVSGSLACNELTGFPELEGLVLNYQNLDPVNMVTGAYNFMYEDLKLEGIIPLSFLRVYNSRYDKGALGTGFTHSYDYSLINDRGIIRVTMPGGEEQIFLTLRGGGYDSLADSGFVLEDAAGGYRMTHEDGAAFIFSNDGKLQTIYNPDGTAVAQLTYNGDELTEIDGIAGSYTLAWSNGHISSVTDNAGRTVSYEHDNDLLTGVTNADGDTLHYTYDGNGYLNSATDFEGEVYIKNEYDGIGRVVKQTFINADIPTVSTVSYDDEARVTTCVDANGLETRYYYDNHRNIQKIGTVIDGTEYTTANTYDGDYRANSASDRLNGATAYEYDSNGNVTKVRYADNTAMTLTYTAGGDIASITDALGNTETYTYSGHSLTEFRDKNGHTTSYTYNALGLPVTVTDALGNQTTYAYDDKGWQLSVTDAEGGVTSFEYDAVGRIVAEHTKVSDSATATTRHTYSKAGKLLKTVDALGGETSYEYNANGFTTSTKDALGGTVTTEYGTNGEPLKRTDANGNETTYEYDKDTAQLVSVTDAEGNETRYTYNDRGLLIQTTDAEGNATTYEYDALDRVAKTIDALDGETIYAYDSMGRTVSETDAEGNKKTYTYDALGRTHTETNAVGVVTEYGYDKVGNTVSVIKDGTVIAKSEYDGAYRVIKTIDGLGNAGTKQYDGVGNVLVSTDREGNATQYTYDKNYNLLKTTDAEGGVSLSAYDALGRVVSETDENGSATTYTYDKNGNVLTETDALSGVVTNTYDARGRVAATTDKLGATTTYTYDAAGNLRKETDANNAYAVYQYDANNNLIQYTNRNNEWVKYAYDCMNRQVKETNQLNHATEYEYDLAGNQTAVIDGNKNKAIYTYDGLNRLVSKTNAEGGMFEYRYDSFGNTAGTTMYGGGDEKAATTYAYDAAGNLLTETSPLGSVTTYTHDKEGNVLTQVDENGKQTAYTYDKLYRMVSRKDADGTATFAYDKAGNMTSAKDGNGTVAFAFDALSRTTAVTNEDGTTTAYTYDAASNRLSITYPDGKAVTTAYDSLGNVKSQTDHDGTGITYTRDAEGRTIKEGHSDGSTTEYDYNAAGLLTLQKEVTKSNSTRRQTAYTYDDAGNIVSENRSGVDIDKKDELVRYYYDKANQLIRTNIEGKNTKYSYDLAGNLLSDGTNTYTYDLQNRLVSKTGKDGTTTYTYDAAGNLIKKAAPDGATEYTYTAQNKLKTGKIEDGQSSTYTYNALNARIKNVQVRDNKNAGHANSDLKDGSHGTDYLDFLMDGRFFWQRTWETEVGTTFQSNFETVTKNYVVDYLSTANRDILVTEDGSFTQRYVYDENSTRISAEYGYAAGTKRGEGGENLQSDFAANDVRKVWYRASHLGSTLFAVDENGKVISHTIYDPWGNPLTETYTDTNFSGIDNSNNYTGYTWDEVLDLYFAQNRFYDPADHRFTQEDPAKAGDNWYTYCGNSITNRVDPYGLEEIQIRKFVESRKGTISWDSKRNNLVVQIDGKYSYLWCNPAYMWNSGGHFYTTDAYLYQALGLDRPTIWVDPLPNTLFKKDTKNGVWYAEVNALQRDAGYNNLYDIAFNVCNYTRFEAFFTAPTKSGVIKEWRIEGWKGNYLNMGIGGEIGLYYRSPNAVDTTLSVDYSSIYNDNNVRYFKSLLCDRLNHYSAVADTDMMLMQFDLYKGSYNPRNLLFIRPATTHWWITGFRPSTEIVNCLDLTMVGSITFPSRDVANAFMRTVKPKPSSRNSKLSNKMTTQLTNTKVSFTWGGYNK